MGVRFRRQEPIGPFIADFACLSARLIVEVDGDTHTDEQRERDQTRDLWFRRNGWFVLRFWDDYVLDQMDDTLHLIAHALEDPASVPDPLNRER